ncbi:hypothetical protein [Streptomyces sp. JB150]|uniref:hypothetical protein n=1 Tax=Streptomyces sp. JB150 TaxID=2714844 RepID=UPI00140A3FAD|nr:hypothetical protein [Streptomyces sp. JB150]QIJ60685.1 hypothetical protein G7Z13_00530 [Streptomyces sp. JB150]
MGPVGGVICLVMGVGLLLWLSLSGGSVTDDWSGYYGAVKVLAAGGVAVGAALLTRRRGDGPGQE